MQKLKLKTQTQMRNMQDFKMICELNYIPKLVIKLK